MSARTYDGWWFWIVVLLVVLLWDDIWDSKWRYAMFYAVPAARVSLEIKPHDCDFWKAPIGEKECHYKKIVETTEWAQAKAGTPIVSYDHGKTWSEFTPEPGFSVPQFATVTKVNVSWEKVED